MTICTDFINEMFGSSTAVTAGDGQIWLQSLATEDGYPQERRTDGDPDEINAFVSKWDKPGRGMYFCVSTIDGIARTKPHVCEVLGLHADIDFKDITDTPADVDRKLAQLRCPPSRVHDSGNGRHCYWLFKEPIAISGAGPEGAIYQDAIEQSLKLLCDLVGGDQSVAHTVALMRLPGSHNTKRGAWHEVATLVNNPTTRYELDDLDEWLSETSPIILRKDRPAHINAIDTNPFMAYAREHGYKPSIDVEQRLARMSYMAGGESAIHATQLAVSASLLTSGVGTEDVVTMILDATKAASAGYGERWNWRREENAIRRMCSDWLKKHPAKEEARKVSAVNTGHSGNGDANIIALAPKLKAKAASGGTPNHIILGGSVLHTIRARGEDILATAGAVWRYIDGMWSEQDDARAWLDAEIEVGADALELQSTIKLINEARQWLLRRNSVYRADVKWDSHGKIPTRSGLLDVSTMALEQARPDHYATWRIECEYEPTAQCPWWDTMLNDFFGDRTEEVRDATKATLQEVLGAALLEDKPRALTRALVLEGPSEAGKTRILDVLAGLFGGRPIATPLDALAGTHGLMEFRRRAPWVLHEAFNQGTWHLSSVVKSILTGDPVQINVKNGAIITQRIKAPVFWGTNHPPQFRETTKAIVNRIIVVKCRVVFDPQNLVGAAKEAQARGFPEPSDMVLAVEMSGLLNWAITGLRRALERGHIVLTGEMISTLEAVRQDSNIAAGFFDECVTFDPYAMVSVPDFCAAFTVWWQENKGEDRRVPSNDSIGRAMAALGDKRVAVDKVELRDMQRRYYAGFRLNSVGLDYWAGASSEGLAKGKTARTSHSRDEVNRLIPESWFSRNSVKRLHNLAKLREVRARSHDVS